MENMEEKVRHNKVERHCFVTMEGVSVIRTTF